MRWTGSWWPTSRACSRARTRRCCSPTSAPPWSRSSDPAAVTTPAPGVRRSPPTGSPRTSSRSTGTRPRSPSTSGPPVDRRIAHALAARADVLVENHKPGALTRFGLDYAQVRAVNPAVIYCSISGFGSGAGADLPGYDLLVQAMGGLMSITGHRRADEGRCRRRRRADRPARRRRDPRRAAPSRPHGRGPADRGDAAHRACSRRWSTRHRPSSGPGSVPTFMGNAHPSIAPYEVFAAADRSMILAVGQRRPVRAAGRGARACRPWPPTRASPRTRPASRTAMQLKAMLETALATRSADEWQESITPAGVPCGPINDIAQGFALAERLGLHPVVEVDDPRRDGRAAAGRQPAVVLGDSRGVPQCAAAGGRGPGRRCWHCSGWRTHDRGAPGDGAGRGPGGAAVGHPHRRARARATRSSRSCSPSATASAACRSARR